MALSTTIKHIDKRPNGVLRFRRRFPKDVAEAIGAPTLQVHVKNRDGFAFHQEYQAIMHEFDRMVCEVRGAIKGKDTRKPIERWHHALLKREGLVPERTALRDARDAAPVEVNERPFGPLNIDPLRLRSSMNQNCGTPKLSLQDAKSMYSQDKQLPQNEVVRLDRVTRRLEAVVGSLEKVALEDLRRDHGRRYMEMMLKTTKSDGQPLSIATCLKECKIIAAMINHAIRESEIDIKNPFIGLSWPKDANPKLNKKLPLPDDLIQRIEARLKDGRTDELPVMWRLLKGTGMRLGEVAGLSQEDIVLKTDAPHILIRPNAIRDLKTASSNRSVPLSGDALAAAKEALKGVLPDKPVFPRYARERGSDAASAALMKVVRAETNDKRLTVHGLRHRVSDKLRDAGTPVEVRHGFLGHSSTAIAESTYGSPRARLIEFMKWAKRSKL